MAQIGRPGLSSQQKNELWARWKAGQSLSDIGRSLGKHAGSIFGVLHSRGDDQWIITAEYVGMRSATHDKIFPFAPAERDLATNKFNVLESLSVFSFLKLGNDR